MSLDSSCLVFQQVKGFRQFSLGFLCATFVFLEIFLYTNDSFILWEFSSDDGHQKYVYQNRTHQDSNNLKTNASYDRNDSLSEMSLRERPFILETLPNEGEHKKNATSLPQVKQLQKSTKNSGNGVLTKKKPATNSVKRKKPSTRKVVVKGKSSQGSKRQKQKQKRQNLEKELSKVTLVKPDHVVDEQKWKKMVKYYPFVSKHSKCSKFKDFGNICCIYWQTSRRRSV